MKTHSSTNSLTHLLLVLHVEHKGHSGGGYSSRDAQSLPGDWSFALSRTLRGIAAIDTGQDSGRGGRQQLPRSLLQHVEE